MVTFRLYWFTWPWATTPALLPDREVAGAQAQDRETPNEGIQEPTDRLLLADDGLLFTLAGRAHRRAVEYA